jgi:hypothetical protein
MESQRKTTGDWISRHAYLLVPAAVVVAVAYTGMGVRPFWLDELITADAVENGLSGLWAHTWEYPLIPYYALMYLWTLGGSLTADWWMRSLSVAFAIGAVLFTGLTGKTMLSRRVGFAAAFLVAISPWMGYYTQNARNYTLGALLVAAATYYAVRSAKDGDKRVWLSYAAVIGLAVIFVQTALIFLVVHPVVLALAGCGRTWLWPWLRSVALASPLVVLAAVMYLSKGSSMHGWLDPPAITDLWEALPQVTRWEPLAWLLVATAVLSRLGLAWLAGVGAAILAIWTVSHLGSSFWLDGVLGMLVGVLALAAASSLQSVSWRHAVLWCAFIALVSAGQLLKMQNLPDETRYAKTLASTIASRGVSAVIATDSTGAARMALRHYAPEVQVSVADPSMRPTGPVWHIGDPSPCPGAQSTQLKADVTITYCPG